MMTLEMAPAEWAKEYFDSAIEHIDATWGAGFAKANPALLGAFMQTAAAAMQAESAIDGARMLTEAVKECAEQLGRWSDDVAFEASPPARKPTLAVVSPLRPTDPV
jgi:hypothetical protein